MRTFVAGSKVVFVEDCAVRRGVIQSIYPNDNIAIVKLNNGETQKVPITRLCFDPSPIEQEEKEEPKKPEYKEEITIKREDFRKNVTKVIGREVKETNFALLGMAFMVFAIDLEKALFDNVVKND